MSSTDPVEQLAGYEAWLETQPLAPATRRAYRGHARRFVEFLSGWPGEGGDPLTDAHARDYAVRDFKSYLKTVRRAKPASVNLALAGVDHFYRLLGTGRPDVRREELAHAAPRALSPEQLQRFMRAVERCKLPRDRAIAVLLVNGPRRRIPCDNPPTEAMATAEIDQQRTVGEAVAAFLARADLAAQSRRSYAQTLNRIAAEVGDDQLVGELDADRLSAVLTQAWGTCAPATWNRHVATTRLFVAFCRAWLAANVAVDVERRRQPADRTRAIPYAQLERSIAAGSSADIRFVVPVSSSSSSSSQPRSRLRRRTPLFGLTPGIVSSGISSSSSSGWGLPCPARSVTKRGRGG